MSKLRAMWNHHCFMEFIIYFLFFSNNVFLGVASQAMDITAFEYNRKFSKELKLGECPSRDVYLKRGNNSVDFATQSCNLFKRGTVTSLPRELNDTRNVPIQKPSDIVTYLGLCNGEAASFLGILHRGECVAIEIASRLKFNDKTMVRAYVEYYRNRMDILNSSSGTRTEYEHYYDGHYYLKNRSYGTLEIIIVQFRFKSKKDSRKAHAVKSTLSPLMSVYMETVRHEVGVPTSLLVVRLSTATEKYDIKKFRKGEYELALRHVQILETEIRYVRERIIDNKINPHLNYALFPFKDNKPEYRIGSNPITWEETSMLEVALRQGISTGKKAARKCRLSKVELCNKARKLLKNLKILQRQIHKVRAEWVNLSAEEKKLFAERRSSRVHSYINVMKRLARDVRKWRKSQKLEKLSRRRKEQNNVRLPESNKIGSIPWFLPG